MILKEKEETMKVKGQQDKAKDECRNTYKDTYNK